MLRQNFTRRMCSLGSTTSLAQESNNITLDPDQKDGAGRPAMRITYHDHDDDLAMMKFMQDRAMELWRRRRPIPSGANR